jgi:hypothetical protein
MEEEKRQALTHLDEMNFDPGDQYRLWMDWGLVGSAAYLWTVLLAKQQRRKEQGNQKQLKRKEGGTPADHFSSAGVKTKERRICPPAIFSSPT